MEIWGLRMAGVQLSPQIVILDVLAWKSDESQ